KPDGHTTNSRDQQRDAFFRSRTFGVGHRLFHEDLPGNSANLRKNHQQQTQQCHARSSIFCSAFINGRAITSTPAMTRQMPSQRWGLIFSPSAKRLINGTSTCTAPVRFAAMFKAT